MAQLTRNAQLVSTAVSTNWTALSCPINKVHRILLDNTQAGAADVRFSTDSTGSPYSVFPSGLWSTIVETSPRHIGFNVDDIVGYLYGTGTAPNILFVE